MKKTIISFCLGMCFVSILSFTTTKPIIEFIPQKSTCEANKIQGFYVFVDSKPVIKYRLISVITSDEFKDKNSSQKGSQQYSSIRDKFIQLAKEQYKDEADGLIFKLCDGCVDKVTVIKFDE